MALTTISLTHHGKGLRFSMDVSTMSLGHIYTAYTNAGWEVDLDSCVCAHCGLESVYWDEAACVAGHYHSFA